MLSKAFSTSFVSASNVISSFSTSILIVRLTNSVTKHDTFAWSCIHFCNTLQRAVLCKSDLFRQILQTQQLMQPWICACNSASPVLGATRLEPCPNDEEDGGLETPSLPNEIDEWTCTMPKRCLSAPPTPGPRLDTHRIEHIMACH